MQMPGRGAEGWPLCERHALLLGSLAACTAHPRWQFGHHSECQTEHAAGRRQLQQRLGRMPVSVLTDPFYRKYDNNDCCGGGTEAQRTAHSAAQRSAAQRSTAQRSTTQHSTAPHRTAQHSTAQHSTAQHSTAQHSTAQHSTAQHSTARAGSSGGSGSSTTHTHSTSASSTSPLRSGGARWDFARPRPGTVDATQCRTLGRHPPAPLHARRPAAGR
jgi:hypothetical protein